MKRTKRKESTDGRKRMKRTKRKEIRVSHALATLGYARIYHRVTILYRTYSLRFASLRSYLTSNVNIFCLHRMYLLQIRNGLLLEHLVDKMLSMLIWSLNEYWSWNWTITAYFSINSIPQYSFPSLIQMTTIHNGRSQG